MNESQKLKKKFISALLALLIAFSLMCTATFAWYIYNTSAHTTKVHMAAGSSVSLEIANSKDGPWSSSVDLASFVGKLDPVSTDSILGGFQKVDNEKDNMASSTDAGERWLARFFKPAEAADYYQTSLWLRSASGDMTAYISDIAYEDDDAALPISTAIRVGLVVHGTTDKEYIYAINTESNPEKEYNTYTGSEGSVLDSSRTDGTTVAFTPLTASSFVGYDPATMETTVKSTSKAIAELKADTPVQVDVYIWMEGCDQDCTMSLHGRTLKNVSISFSGVTE